MKNKITLIIILIAIILLIISIFHGISMGKVQVLSVSQIQEKNNELNNKINEASIITSINYPDNIEILEETFDRYIIQKQKYEELSYFASDEKSNIYETKQYDISYLWRVLGKYTTARNLSLGIDVQKNSSDGNLYNFNFTVSGEYVNISQFITDIENDSDLYFRIYNFRMSGNGGDNIISTFTVKNIAIDSSTIITTD